MVVCVGVNERSARSATGLVARRLVNPAHRCELGRCRLRAFSSISIMRQLISAWVADYNTASPHSSLGYKTPATYAGTLTASEGVTLAEALTPAG